MSDVTDKDRLDWLDRKGGNLRITELDPYDDILDEHFMSYGDIREAIDREMAKEPKEEE